MMRQAISLCACLALCTDVALAMLKPPLSHWAVPDRGGDVRNRTRPTSADCKELYFDQLIDHFAFHKEDSTIEGGTYKQRYFLCDQYWDAKAPGPIFFYAGNEADVTLYVNASGLMWENAADFGALLLFAEHRYYGRSQPFGAFAGKRLDFLSSEQALADYATLIDAVKGELHAEEAPVVAFGGSYGGMLAAWFRIKYPNVIDGAIAASAPIWNFLGDGAHPPATYSFYRIVTDDASAKGGATDNCAANTRSSWDVLWDVASAGEEGLQLLSSTFRLCPHSQLESSDDVWQLAYWIMTAWSYMAMGNFPYPSSYILNGNGKLPPFPVRVACEALAFDPQQASKQELLEGVREAVGVYYNYSGANMACYDLRAGVNEESRIVEEHWEYQYCTEMFMPQGANGRTDMFWPQLWNASAAAEACYERWGIHPREHWINSEYWGHALSSASNIVFSNGNLDPWSGTGVLDSVSDSVVALVIEEGAHHLDLMFSDPDDPDSVIQVRRQELSHIKKWVEQARSRSAQARL